MSIRTVIVYAVLFAVASAGAFWSWTREPADAGAEEGLVVLSASPKELRSISFTSPDIDVSLERRTDEHGEYVWAKTTSRRAAQEDPSEPAPAPTKQEASFKAGVAADQLFEDLAPFRVSRRLDVAADRLAEFGLDEPGGKLTVTTDDGKASTFEVGDTGYGHRNVYLRDASDGAVYVAKKSIIAPLERADTRLPDKRLFDFERADVARVTVTSGEQSLQLEQRNREDSAAARWTAPGSEEPNPSAESWLDKIFRLRSSGYVPEGEASGQEAAFAVKLEPADKKPVVLTVYRGTTPQGEPAWYAKSDFTRGVVELNSASAADVADDLGTLFSAP